MFGFLSDNNWFAYKFDITNSAKLSVFATWFLWAYDYSITRAYKINILEIWNGTMYLKIALHELSKIRVTEINKSTNYFYSHGNPLKLFRILFHILNSIYLLITILWNIVSFKVISIHHLNENFKKLYLQIKSPS